MRQLVALLTGLSMLHLTLVGADLSCAVHGPHGSTHQAAAHSAEHHVAHTAHAMAGMAMDDDAPQALTDGAMAAVTPASARSAPDCATPVETHCCDAMSNCSVSTTVGAVLHFVSSPWPAARNLAHVPAELASVASGPEPPPPKI